MQGVAVPHLVTAIVMTKNEERLIARCLEGLAFADEVLVLDNASTDRTVEIAEELGARVIVDEVWRDYGDQMNHAAQMASHDWVFECNADEFVTPRLQRSIRALLATSTLDV